MSILEFLQNYGQALLQGTLVTCAQFLLATLVAVAAAGAAGIGKLSSKWPIRSVSVVYIEIFRGTSLLVQLYWIFFVLPLFGITLPNFTAGYISVGLNIGAYGAEIVRGA
ncbi:ectoine/hydroxyectoine ABC transporter permease subunit EhuC, partial [Mesorhizobium sp. M6A.T.Cr.TU.017.01.1.1]